MAPEKTLEAYISSILQNRLFEQALPSLATYWFFKELFNIWSNTELLVPTVVYRRIVPELKKNKKIKNFTGTTTHLSMVCHLSLCRTQAAEPPRTPPEHSSLPAGRVELSGLLISMGKDYGPVFVWLCERDTLRGLCRPDRTTQSLKTASPTQ